MLDKDMGAIEGVISNLSAKRTHRPQGYPFSKVTVYCISDSDAKNLSIVFQDFTFKPAATLDSMVKLDFKKAGPVYGKKVKELAKDLSQVPKEYLTISTLFPVSDNTTKCRRFYVEVEDEDIGDLWTVIKLKKSVKKFLTEELKLNIVPTVLGGPEDQPLTYRTILTLVDCKERIYEPLKEYGPKVFLQNPLILRVPDRHQLPNPSEDDYIIDGVRFKIDVHTAGVPQQ